MTENVGQVRRTPDAPTPDETISGSGVTVIVCSSCRSQDAPDAEPRPGSLLANATAEAAPGSGVTVRHVKCLGNCNRGLSAAMVGDGCWSYVFGGLDTTNGPDLIAGATLLSRSDDGVLPFRGRPQALKGALVSRLPPLEFTEDVK